MHSLVPFTHWLIHLINIFEARILVPATLLGSGYLIQIHGRKWNRWAVNWLDKVIQLLSHWWRLHQRPLHILKSCRFWGDVRRGLQKSCRGTTTCRPHHWLPLPLLMRWRDFWLQPLDKTKHIECWLASFMLLNQTGSLIIFTHTFQGKCLSMLQRWAWASLLRTSLQMALCSLSCFNTGRWSFFLFPPFQRWLIRRYNLSRAAFQQKKPMLTTLIIQENFFLIDFGAGPESRSVYQRLSGQQGPQREGSPATTLQMRLLRPREGKNLVQGHTAKLLWRKGQHASLRIPSPMLLTHLLVMTTDGTTENPGTGAWGLQNMHKSLLIVSQRNHTSFV